MKSSPLFWAVALSFSTSAYAQAALPPAASAGRSNTSPRNPAQELAALFVASSEARLKRDPVSGLFRGDLRYADQYGNFLSDEYYAAERTAAETELAQLALIDRNALSPSDRLAYDVFKWQRTNDLEAVRPDLLALTSVRPLTPLYGFHSFFAELSSGSGLAPYKTLKDLCPYFQDHPFGRRAFFLCFETYTSGDADW